MPKILLDLRMVRGRLHGIARYALELARRLPALAPDLTFEALAPPDGLPGDLGPLALPKSVAVRRARAEFLSAFEQPLFPVTLIESRCDLFHATSFSVPALWNGKLVATLHDANHVALPENYGPGRVAYYRIVVAPRSARASALITVSEFSRDELAKHLGLNPFRLQVIPNGVDPRFAPATSAELAAFRRRHGLPPKYFAVVGSTKPHKNLQLVAGMARELPAPVVLLAGRHAASELGFPESTVELTELPEAELPAFYSGAVALLLPSTYEGFGLPAIEAMACGTPVIASEIPALREVIGDAGVLVELDAPLAWRDAAAELLRNDARRAELSALAVERARRYNWDDVTKKTLAVYRRVLEAGR